LCRIDYLNQAVTMRSTSRRAAWQLLLRIGAIFCSISACTVLCGCPDQSAQKPKVAGVRGYFEREAVGLPVHFDIRWSAAALLASAE
jgi:hypothetical protein